MKQSHNNSILLNLDDRAEVITRSKRQSVSWTQFCNEPQTFKFSFIFHGPDEREFSKIKKKEPTRITLPQELRPVYREVFNFSAEVAARSITNSI
jgi:hypothetical protein